MMNKKAIAAFAAGATLLAGFAMATPAFAAVPRTVSTDEAKDDSFALKTLKAALKKAYDDADTAENEKTNAKAAATIVDENGDLLNKADYKLNDKGEVVKKADDSKDDAATKANTYREKLATYKAALEAVKTAEDAVNAATPKVEPSKDAKRVALAKLDEAKENLGKAQEAKDKAFAEADAAFNAKHEAENNLKAAQRALKDYQDENAKDKGSRAYNAEVESLKKVINEAKEALAAAKTKFADADKAFNEAATKFNKALSEYAGAYKNAQASKADVSTYPTPASLAPLSTDYKYGTNFVPSTTVQPGKPGAAKPGKPGQAAGQAGANAAAGVKTTVVEKKKDGGKKLPGTGVGVTLTALAATMLAGMGAAVRKARH